MEPIKFLVWQDDCFRFFELVRGRATLGTGLLRKYIGVEVCLFYHATWGRISINAGLFYGVSVWLHIQPPW